MAEEARGVVVPLDGAKRSTSALGRAVISEALESADPVGAQAARRETDWRRQYGAHFRRLVEAGMLSEASAADIARRGLDAVHRRMQVVTADGERPVSQALNQPVEDRLTTAAVHGVGSPERELTIPYRGKRLGGDDLRRQLDAWVGRGSMEPSAADAVKELLEHPEWLSMPGRTMVVLGAASEMGPLRSLLRWGATVAAVDLPKRDIWRETVDIARASGGILLAPVGREGPLEDRAGADLLHDLPAVGEWIADIKGPIVLGNYVYADGAVNLRLSTAVDALTEWLIARRADLELAFLATPTDVFGVPREAVEFSEKAYRAGKVARAVRPALRFVSGGRLLKRNYAPGSDPGLNDSMVLQQGPNYLLAKRIQRWRATAARRDGVGVSMLVAPPTRTRSVLKNRALAAAYAGAHRFGVEVFAASTSNTLMAALLIHDLYARKAPRREPWLEEADKAVHGGLWRGAYDPRSALGIAVVLGMGRNKS